jgi:hypothetical protein
MGLQEIRDWYEDLELRDKLEENQSIVVLGLVVLIVFCLSLVMCQVFGGGASSATSDVKLVYYDLGNQTIRVVDHTYPDLPLSPLEGTTDVFLASVFACEECPEGKVKDGMTMEELKAEGMFIGWLEKFDPELSEEQMMFGEGNMYRTVEKDRWYKTTDRGYEVITNRVYEKCSNARLCRP